MRVAEEDRVFLVTQQAHSFIFTASERSEQNLFHVKLNTGEDTRTKATSTPWRGKRKCIEPDTFHQKLIQSFDHPTIPTQSKTGSPTRACFLSLLFPQPSGLLRKCFSKDEERRMDHHAQVSILTNLFNSARSPRR